MVALSLSTHLIQAQDTDLGLVYFSYYQGEGPQLMVLTETNEVRQVFQQNNDGYFDSISPQGDKLVLLRFSHVSSNTMPRGRLWLANLNTGEQRFISSSDAETATSLWSPDGRYILFTEITAIPLASTDYNYGHLFIYDTMLNRIEPLEEIQAFWVDWYPDNRSILFWNKDLGYFRYPLDSTVVTPVNLEGLDNTRFFGGDISPRNPYLVSPSVFPKDTGLTR